MGMNMLKKALFVTTALVAGISMSFAKEETGTPVNANAQFASWYSGSPTAGAKYNFAPRNGSTLLYQQSASSGFSTNAVLSDNFASSSGFCCYGYLAADDF